MYGMSLICRFVLPHCNSIFVSCVCFIKCRYFYSRGISKTILFFVYLINSQSVISVAQSCPTLCDPMNHSTPGLPVHHQLPEFTQTHVHRVDDAIQPSHPMLSPSPPDPIPPSIRVFSNESTLPMRWPKYWSFSLEYP